MNSALNLLLFLFLAFTGAIVNAGNTVQKSIFILAGQSNMAGRGGVKSARTPTNKTVQVWDGIIPPECQPNPSIFRLNAKLGWELATEPLHADIDTTKTCGVGPGMCFAREVLNRVSSSSPLGVIGLVPCAIGGTSITQWSRGTTLYNKTLERAAAALRDGGKIRALLWYQGETEAQIGVGSFALEVPRFFTSIRQDLHMPQLPIIQVALPPTLNLTFTQVVRNIQLELKLPFLSTVDAKGLELKRGDPLHLSSSAQVHLGKKMARAFLFS
ncbi:PREDICTED: probable carbohydrate esterase At4g34215 [Ipomoea nil]|uniref:probable carbohydrate esterase At4g34215 n=1 Tax=Ipomoea nil TaxID=35883 RepID=UPI000900B77D|nr:PREDICTED: probable carbohydrate esterase At4g34215 [Ipomoea nil]